jgi:hypothetical protein
MTDVDYSYEIFVKECRLISKESESLEGFIFSLCEQNISPILVRI